MTPQQFNAELDRKIKQDGLDSSTAVIHHQQDIAEPFSPHIKEVYVEGKPYCRYVLEPALGGGGYVHNVEWLHTPAAPAAMPASPLGSLVRTFGSAEIVDVAIHDFGIVVTLRERSNAMLASNPPRPVPDRIWRETFSMQEKSQDGKLRKVSEQAGTHKPACMQPEQFIFDDPPANPTAECNDIGAL